LGEWENCNDNDGGLDNGDIENETQKRMITGHAGNADGKRDYNEEPKETASGDGSATTRTTERRMTRILSEVHLRAVLAGAHARPDALKAAWVCCQCKLTRNWNALPALAPETIPPAQVGAGGIA